MTSEAHGDSNETIIMATGNISLRQRTDVLQALTQVGMAAYVVGPATNPDVREPLLSSDESLRHGSFNDIKSPLQFLGYEHMYDFQAKHEGKFPARKVHGIFASLVIPRTLALGRSVREVGARIDDPSTVGLIVRTRDDVKFPKLDKALEKNRDEDVTRKVVQVGSVIAYAGLLKDPDFRKRLYGMGDLDLERPKLIILTAKALAKNIKRARTKSS